MCILGLRWGESWQVNVKHVLDIEAYQQRGDDCGALATTEDIKVLLIFFCSSIFLLLLLFFLSNQIYRFGKTVDIYKW